ncbi:MAG TPA: ATP-grasp domain-containing protein, partial [Methanosarcina sp.]|nr:ATP-grasp domain-containing protein [Methanosarcina sp.]
LEPFDFNVQKDNWNDRMLNYDSIVCSFKDAEMPFERAFVRPIHDSKVFAGGIFFKEDLNEWRHKVCVLEEDYGDSLNKNTIVQIASLKNIFSEYRFWVVKGKIITSSLYKMGKSVIYSNQVPEFVTRYVEECIQIWQPHEAFVIDVADTEEGMKIVEINTLNSSGFYAADIQKLVISLEESFNIMEK